MHMRWSYCDQLVSLVVGDDETYARCWALASCARTCFHRARLAVGMGLGASTSQVWPRFAQAAPVTMSVHTYQHRYFILYSQAYFLLSWLGNVLVRFEEGSDVDRLAAPEVPVDGPVESELEGAAVELACEASVNVAGPMSYSCCSQDVGLGRHGGWCMGLAPVRVGVSHRTRPVAPQGTRLCGMRSLTSPTTTRSTYG